MRIQVCAFAVLLVGSVAAGQPGESLVLGTVSVTIGAPADQVREAVSKQYTLKLSTPDGPDAGPVQSFIVWDGTTPIGNLAFRNGHLISVFKYWDPPNQQAGADLAQKLYAAVGSLVKDGHRSCVLDTGASEEPRVDQRVVFITCGHRSLEVSVLRSEEHGTYATVLEKLE